MQYQIQIKFADERDDVVMQAKDERSAFDTIAAMSRVPGVKAVSMAGIRREFLPGGSAAAGGGGGNDHQVGHAPEQGENDRVANERVSDREPTEPRQALPPLEMRPASPYRPQETIPAPAPAQTQATEPMQVPEWMRAVKNAAAAIGAEYTPSNGGGGGGWDNQQRMSSSSQTTGSYQPSPQPATYEPQPQSSRGDGRSPLEQHSGHLEFGIGQAKRIKRTVEVPRPAAPPQQFQSHPQPQPQSQMQDSGQSLGVMLGLDTPGAQGLGGGRPLNKQDADMLIKARQTLEQSFTDPQPGKNPYDVASAILQRCVPLYSNVNWGNQPAYREQFNTLVSNCQRILTGQGAPGQGVPGQAQRPQGRPVVFDQ